MQEIRVELSAIPASRNLALHATIGTHDVTQYLLSTRMIALRGYLPPAQRGYTSIGRQRTRTLNNQLSLMNIDQTLTPAILADALRLYLTEIAPEILATLDGNGGNVAISALESEEEVIERLTASEPAFLSIGGRSFRLQSVGEPSEAGGKMLVAMRRKAAEAIRKEREAMMGAATREVSIIRRQVESERVAFRAEQAAAAARAAQEAALRLVIPDWVRHNNLPVRSTPGRPAEIEVLQRIVYQPTRFSYPNWPMCTRTATGRVIEHETVEIEWAALAANPVSVWMWIAFNPVDGAYALAHSKVAVWSPRLPHASHTDICCQPQGLPARIDSLEAIGRVTSAIQRTFKEVNLSSLLVSVGEWAPEIQASTPQGVRDWSAQYHEHGPEETDASQFGGRQVEREAAQTIWTGAVR